MRATLTQAFDAARSISETCSMIAPGLETTAPFCVGTANKSLNSYSLKVAGAVSQQVTANGRNRGSNGRNHGLGGRSEAQPGALLVDNSRYRMEKMCQDGAGRSVKAL